MIRELRREGEFLPALVLSADATPKARHDALGAGRDRLPHQATRHDRSRACGSSTTSRLGGLHLRLARAHEELDDARELQDPGARASAVRDAAAAVPRERVPRRRDTRAHEPGRGVSPEGSQLLAGEPPERVQLIEHAAPLHDLGKVGIPDHVLLKPGKLTPEEFEIVREHPGIGARLIGETDSEILRWRG